MRQSVTFCLRIPASSPRPHPAFSSSISFFALRRINNQCRSQYCRYEINLPPAVHRAMLLQENQCPPTPLLLFSGAGQGVRTSALIIQMLTLLSESEPERERGGRERLRRNSRQCCLSKLYQAALLSDDV